MKHYYILLLLAAALGFSACESDMTTANQQNTPKYSLEVIPDTLYGDVYQEYLFRARLNGVAGSDVYFKWKFSDGYTPNDTQPYVYHEFHTPGSHTVTVSAFDIFRDTLIATKVIPAFLSTEKYEVTLSPGNTDTTLTMNNDGTFQEMAFNVSTDFPMSKGQAYWSFSDGITDTVNHYSNNTFTRRFKAAGTYTVKVRIKDYADNFIGEDSSSITIRHEPFDITSLTSAKRVSVTLSLDTVPASLAAQGYTNPIQFGQDMINNVYTTSSWNGNSFSSQYQFNGMLSTTLYQRADYKISGTLSSDLQTLEQATLSVNDSTNESNTTIKAVDLGFTVHDLKFHAITDKEIIYKIVAPPFTMIASDLRYRSLSLYLGPCTPANAIVMHYVIGNEKKYPLAYVVFTRK